MDYSDSIEIEASPDVVFARIADLPEMGRLSPENTGGQWLQGATGPGPGVKFRGTNERGDDQWSTTARITTYEPPTRFVFDVTFGPFRISQWSFSIEPTPHGCRVIESWSERRNALVRRSDKKSGIDRAEFTKVSIATTLANLKLACERPRG